MEEHCIVEISIYRAVLFDMDGVVTDTMPLHYESWRQAFEPFGINVEQMDVYLLEGMTAKMMVKEISEAKGRSLSPEEMDRIVENKSAIFNGLVREKAKAYDGVIETLHMLHNNGLKIALVTSSRKDAVQAVLKKVGLDKSFDTIVVAEDIEHGKPSPEPYRAAIEKLGVESLNCVVIENAPLGIKSARAAKVDYIIAVTTTLPESYLTEADDIMSSITDLEQCMARRLAARPGRAVI